MVVTAVKIETSSTIIRIQHITALITGIILLALLAESNGKIFDLPWLQGFNTRWQFMALVAGAALVGFGLSIGEPRKSADSILPHGWERWALGGMMLAGLAIRAWNLEEAVFMYVDEFGSVYTVVTLRDVTSRLLVPSWEIAGWSQVYGYMQAFTAQLFGANLIGLRAISPIVGTLTIPAVYGLGATLFNRRVGLLAALWLTTFPPHIHFSRLGVPNIADPLFGVLALVLLARGWQTGRGRDFALAGVMLGLTQYFYEAGRLLFPILAAGFALTLILPLIKPKNPPTISRVNLWNLARTGLAAVLVGAPAHYALIAAGISPTMRFSAMNVLGDYLNGLRTQPLELLQNRILPPFLHYVWTPDASQLYYGGQFGLVLPYIVPFFLLGIGWALWHWRQPRYLLLLVWLFGVAFGNGFIEQNVFSSRYVVALPALALVIALGFRVLALMLKRRRLVIGLAVLLAGSQIVYYLSFHLPLYNRQIRPFRDFAEIVPRAINFPPETQLHLITDDAFSYWQFDTLQAYFNLRFEFIVTKPDELTAEMLATLQRDVSHAFFVIPEDTISIGLIRAQFDAAEPTFSPHNVPLDRQYGLIFIPSEIP
ncbi:MAG: glycosyltransferase family 39 protein [Anaerolineae bacterium]|nr:glycosyltransferase family 39 protein [Anaerolineae bacterium]